MLSEYIQLKLNNRKLFVFLSAVCCGVAMGFVTTFSIVLSRMTNNLVLGKFIFGSAFSALLLLTVLSGYELFTGNTMLLTAIHKKDKAKKILLNLFFVYFGNLLGCLIAALIIKATSVHKTFDLNEYLLKIFIIKTEMNIFKMILLGICANYFVCMGVYLAFKVKTATDKFVSLFFPICIFCVLGFEHSIANMFTLFYALFVGGGSFVGLLINLLFVTIGNIIGGVLFALSTKVISHKSVQKEKNNEV